MTFVDGLNEAGEQAGNKTYSMDQLTGGRGGYSEAGLDAPPSLATRWSAKTEFVLAIGTIILGIFLYGQWLGTGDSSEEFFDSSPGSSSYLVMCVIPLLVFATYRLLVIFVATRKDPYAISEDLHKGSFAMQLWVRMSICSRHYVDVILALGFSTVAIAIVLIVVAAALGGTWGSSGLTLRHALFFCFHSMAFGIYDVRQGQRRG